MDVSVIMMPKGGFPFTGGWNTFPSHMPELNSWDFKDELMKYEIFCYVIKQ